MLENKSSEHMKIVIIHAKNWFFLVRFNSCLIDTEKKTTEVKFKTKCSIFINIIKLDLNKNHILK